MVEKPQLLGGFWNILEQELDDFPETVGNVLKLSHLMKSIIFQRGRAKNHQPAMVMQPGF